jgi:hypothetical protein
MIRQSDNRNRKIQSGKQGRIMLCHYLRDFFRSKPLLALNAVNNICSIFVRKKFRLRGK